MFSTGILTSILKRDKVYNHHIDSMEHMYEKSSLVLTTKVYLYEINMAFLSWMYFQVLNKYFCTLWGWDQ